MSVPNLLWTPDKFVPVPDNMMEQIVDKLNLMRACKRVYTNGGSAGIDGMKTDRLPAWLQRNIEKLQNSLLEGIYQPQPVRAVKIEKPGGGKRILGIPTVVDRLIQQAIHQVLNPYFDPEFSPFSFGFRKGFSTTDAVLLVQKYQQEGKRWVIDVDLSKFFDEVNHDVLMSLIKRKVKDVRLLKLIDKYLRTGIMHGGVASPRSKGTPQGSPLSPLLSNILLNELDKELEKRGHSFCRYADDFVILVRSRKSAERVFTSITRFIEKRLKLKINQTKSRVIKGHQLIFLGYVFTSDRNVRLTVPKSIRQRFRMKARELFRKGRGMNIQKFIVDILNPFIRGWINYYKHSNVTGFAEELDGWIRRRLRLIIWRQWKKPRTRFRRLTAMGYNYVHAMKCAYNGRGAWWNSGAQHMQFCFPKKYFDRVGLVSMLYFIVRC